MPGWLEKATRVLIRTSPAVPEPPPAFEIACPCGSFVRGFRRSQFQRALCKKCGEPFYILARNVYPPVAAPPGMPPVVASRSKKLADAVAVEVADEIADPELRAPESDAEFEKAEPSPAASKSRPRAARRPRNKLALETIERAPARVFTPLRIALAVTLLLGGVTGYHLVRGRRVAQAERDFRAQHEQGLIALREGEFATAAGYLKEAEQALDVLERDDLTARQTRQMRREAEAIANLMSVPLLTVCLEGEQAASEQKLPAWQEQVQRRFQGMWLVLQTTAVLGADSAGAPTLQLRSPLSLGTTPVRFEMQGTLGPHAFASREPSETIVAAQFQSCLLTESPARAWVVRLSGPTAFLWTDARNLAAIGLGPDELHSQEQLQSILDQQARVLKVLE